jgi:hypothetical protein
MAEKSQRNSAGISARLRVVGLAASAAVVTAAAQRVAVKALDIFMRGVRGGRETRKRERCGPAAEPKVIGRRAAVDPGPAAGVSYVLGAGAARAEGRGCWWPRGE